MNTELQAFEMPSKSIHGLALIVKADWKKPYFGAVPYIEAMMQIYHDDEKYGMDDAKSICTYFLANATTWRGHSARMVKAEIKRRFNIK